MSISPESVSGPTRLLGKQLRGKKEQMITKLELFLIFLNTLQLIEIKQTGQAKSCKSTVMQRGLIKVLFCMRRCQISQDFSIKNSLSASYHRQRG